MSERVIEACNESSGSWLPIIEYSVRTGMSLSTIRRKIKSNKISYKLENGKYLILFDEKGPVFENKMTVEVPKREEVVREIKKEKVESMPVVEKSVVLLGDAFEQVLREKDKHIRLLEKRNAELEDRLSELKLLVQVLEEKYDIRY